MHPNNNISRQALILAYISLTFLGLCDNIRGPLYPEILASFPVSNTVGSIFFALASTAGFLGGMLSSRLDHHYGTIRTLRFSVIVMLVSQLLFSLSPGFSSLLFSALVFGASLGVMGVVTNLLVVHSFEPGPVKNRAVSGLHSMYAGASLLAPLVVNAIVYLGIPFSVWRMGFVFTTGFGAFVLFWTYWGAPQQFPKISSTPKEASHPQEMPAQVFYGVIVSCYALCEIMVSSRMALYMRRQFDASLSESTWYTALFFVCLFSSRLLFSFWSPRIGLKSQGLVSLFLSMVFLWIGITYHPLGLALSGLCMGPFYPLMMVSASHLFPNSVSRALGWAVGLSSLFVVMMHLSVGFITDHWGLRMAFYIGPTFCFIALVMLGTYEKIFRRLQHSF